MSVFFLRIWGELKSLQVVKQSPDSHLWQSFLRANQVPSPLAEAIPLPRPPNAPPDAPVNTTTNPVQYLLAAYLTWLQPFEQHMTRHRQANQQRQAAAAGADGRPPSSANGTSQPGQAPSPAQTTVSSPAPNGISTSSGLTTSSSAPATESFTTSNSNHIPQAKDARPAPLPKSKSKELPNKPVPTPIKTDVEMQPTFEAVADTPAANLAKKRKRDKRGELDLFDT